MVAEANTDTATEVLKDQKARSVHAAVQRLLHCLRDFVRVYPLTSDAEMPEHELAWVSGLGVSDDPGQTILQTLKEHPELWAQAIPDDCCIVPRAMLEKCCGKDVAGVLAAYGEDAVANNAARARYKAESEEMHHLHRLSRGE